MNARNSNQQKYSNAGEQAGRVISEFISIADDFSKRFEKEFSAKGRSCRRATDGESDTDSYSSENRDYNHTDSGTTDSGKGVGKGNENEWSNAGAYLRELREAAGYTVDGFAKAMNRQGAARKIRSVEDGQDIFPDDWLDQMSALLKQNDPMEFFERLRGLYGAEQQTAESGDISAVDMASTEESVASKATQRRQKLQNVFSDGQLEDLTDSQFEELLQFAETNLQSVLQLIRNK